MNTGERRTSQFDYIRASDNIVAVHVRNGSADSLYYVLADHLGSWEKAVFEWKTENGERRTGYPDRG